ncbi:MAG: succinate dehydrogenase, hydrophobic membrane anchor protein [Hyphomicrobiales bacterium]|nr:succinate dehydrogenase, hydrophobic membrane anchor protein [Hyphomicrobiales bacterium]MBV9426811.1 succinate dehydrogenase, hydrophobic membrane anchor protein [Bradyrhizobiaceae bacterium]
MSMRTPLGRVRGLGAAGTGTDHFWVQRVTAVAGIPLTVGFIVIVAMLVGRNHAATVQILASPIVALTMILFIATIVYHMWIGMQVIIEDYVNDPLHKAVVVMANTFFCCVMGLASIFAVLKISFGV